MGDDYWITRIWDNRVRGLVAELSEAIADCEDADLLHSLRATLRLGLINQASSREESLRNANRKRKLPTVRRVAL
jgi:hypothetical protein